MILRHFKEEFIIKNSVNGGAPLSRWKLRDDAILTLFLGYKDGVAHLAFLLLLHFKRDKNKQKLTIFLKKINKL
ncbi:hypothetical protein OUZ56_017202 [Daphnia magna]|uniref:Uncharacterized protein n=1 Tax=Daphnia magna TaxID=35525 RepID=A0ABR0ASG1_9CRUS|nr:hypothetical protein OUZ56_017202 [Daphnia magna]